ncbi:Hypothetical protein KVN_LOCUS63 [uncultured virus]|nr:Hypothetical protein KVN_LOCUS63 [uncultured virus]
MENQNIVLIIIVIIIIFLIFSSFFSNRQVDYFQVDKDGFIEEEINHKLVNIMPECYSKQCDLNIFGKQVLGCPASSYGVAEINKPIFLPHGFKISNDITCKHYV